MPRLANKKGCKSYEFHLPSATFPWCIGDIVEMKTKQTGYRGAWFRVEIKKVRLGRNGKLYSTVIYKDYPDDSEEEIVAIDIDQLTKRTTLMIRPLPPPATKESTHDENELQNSVHAVVRDYWEVGDLVDWRYNDCWWSAEVIILLRDGCFQLKCPCPSEGEGGEYMAKESDMRASLNWSLEEQWTAPPSKVPGMKPCTRLVGPVLYQHVGIAEFLKPVCTGKPTEEHIKMFTNEDKLKKPMKKLSKDDTNNIKDFHKGSLTSRTEHKLQLEGEKQSHAEPFESFKNLRNQYEDNEQEMFYKETYSMVSSDATPSERGPIEYISQEDTCEKQKAMIEIHDKHRLSDNTMKEQLKEANCVRTSRHQDKTEIDPKDESTLGQTTLQRKGHSGQPRKSLNTKEVTSEQPPHPKGESTLGQTTLLRKGHRGQPRKSLNTKEVTSEQPPHPKGESTLGHVTLKRKRDRGQPRKSLDTKEVTSAQPPNRETETPLVPPTNVYKSRVKQKVIEDEDIKASRDKILRKSSKFRSEGGQGHLTESSIQVKDVQQIKLEKRFLKPRKSLNTEEVISGQPLHHESESMLVAPKNVCKSRVKQKVIKDEGTKVLKEKIPRKMSKSGNEAGQRHTSELFIHVEDFQQTKLEKRFSRSRKSLNTEEVTSGQPLHHESETMLLAPKNVCNSRVKQKVIKDEGTKDLKEKILRKRSKLGNEAGQGHKTESFIHVQNLRQTKLEKRSPRPLEVGVEQTSEMGILVDVATEKVKQSITDEKKRKRLKEEVTEEGTCVENRCRGRSRKVTKNGGHIEEEKRGFKTSGKVSEQKIDTRNEVDIEPHQNPKRKKKTRLELNVAQEVKSEELVASQKEKVVREATTSTYAPTTTGEFGSHEVWSQNQKVHDRDAELRICAKQPEVAEEDCPRHLEQWQADIAIRAAMESITKAEVPNEISQAKSSTRQDLRTALGSKSTTLALSLAENDKPQEPSALSGRPDKTSDSEASLPPEDGFIISDRLKEFPDRLSKKSVLTSTNPARDAVLDWDLQGADKPVLADNLPTSICGSLGSISKENSPSSGALGENIVHKDICFAARHDVDANSCSLKFGCARGRPSQDYVRDPAPRRSSLMREPDTAHVLADYSCLRKIIDKPVIKYKIVLSRKLVINARRELWSKGKFLNRAF